MVKSHKWKNLKQNHISLSVSNTLYHFLQSHPCVSEFFTIFVLILNLGVPLDYHAILEVGVFTVIYIVSRA